MNDRNLNSEYWKQLFDKYDILHRVENEGFFQISADQIKEYREPRLMAKFDHMKNLPQVFSDNQLAILPIARGEYIISHFEAYHDFEVEASPICKVSLPAYIQSFDTDNIQSEAIALNCAFASGIIADFMEDSDIIATVSGRMGSGAFSFTITDTKIGIQRQIDVSNSQIEIDAAYEGVHSLALIEAKRDISEDFIIRQLYYPYRVWKRRVTKCVRPIFVVYSNCIYRLYEYAFDNSEDYNSLRLVKQMNYSVEDTAISVSDIQMVLNQTALVNEPNISFPQADKIERVINLCELVSTQELSRAEVTEQYDFDERQTSYYTDAARYLGLLDKRKANETVYYSITDKGRRILQLRYKQRQLEYCSLIVAHKAFHDSLCLYLRTGVLPSTDEIVRIMRESNIYQVESESTFVRRASTVKSWINWIVSLINE